MPSESFRKEIEEAINRNNKEAGSNTPDFILASYLKECLSAFDRAVLGYGPSAPAREATAPTCGDKGPASCAETTGAMAEVSARFVEEAKEGSAREKLQVVMPDSRCGDLEAEARVVEAAQRWIDESSKEVERIKIERVDQPVRDFSVVQSTAIPGPDVLAEVNRLKEELDDALAEVGRGIKAQTCVTCGQLICPPMQCGSCIEKEMPVKGMPARPVTAALREEVEQLRVQLAGCGVAALGGTAKRTAVVEKGDYGWSPAYQDVLELRRKYEDAAGIGDARKEKASDRTHGAIMDDIDNEASFILKPGWGLPSASKSLHKLATEARGNVGQLNAALERMTEEKEKWEKTARERGYELARQKEVVGVR
jgi:GrpB-like predicted nucleotidyltransferase (UPF0157 family)